MSAAARLFDFLQGADFYRALHEEAANCLADGAGRRWLDVGCGPGLLTRIAARKAYAARGIDADAAMIETARRLAACGGGVVFERASLAEVAAAPERYDVVSASSLLVVTSDPAAALSQIMSLVAPGGVALIIEASQKMSVRGAAAAIASGRLGRRAFMMLVWALARSDRALPDDILAQSGFEARRQPLLGGFANAWIVERRA